MDINTNISERPWGNYIKLFQESGVWVKRIEVNPGARLSLQKHAHRSEKWNIVTGKGLVVIDDKEIEVSPGSVVDVPLGAKTIRADLLFIISQSQPRGLVYHPLCSTTYPLSSNQGHQRSIFL